MNPAAYLQMAETESRHWWFQGRRAILGEAIKALQLPANAEILEIGCGTGGNLAMLSGFGRVSALEMDSTAREIAMGKTGSVHDIKPGKCPDDIPFAEGRFDLICMFDVLEHIDQDEKALAAMKGLLKRDGVLLLTVPAYQWLWGRHDEFLHHKRRYSLRELWRKITAAGFKPEKISHFNCFLFPLALVARIKDKLLPGSNSSGTSVPPAGINALFRKVFALERHFLKLGGFPFGVSLLAIARVDHN